ncbi:MAG: chemotaxis protein CheX [Gammaproteobacteria bacterium]|nr:chemotaxis protein CheX [Gammaproteobacteria bacterium]
MNIDFINPFLSSLSNVLETMGGIKCQIGKPTLKNSTTSKGDVTGIIGMAGKNIKGSLAISFSQAVIIDIVEKMVGEKVSKIDETVIDMVGELTNMTTGGAKNLLLEKGYDFDMATPAVVSGLNHKVAHMAKGKIILIPFSTQEGKFYIELCFDETK